VQAASVVRRISSRRHSAARGRQPERRYGMATPDRILIFSPHPDDVELFLGGTALKHVHAGATVRVVMMTRGEKGSVLSLLGRKRQEDLKRVRTEELRRRYELSPSLELSFLDLPDMGIRQSEASVTRVLEELREVKPDCVYLPESTKGASFYTHPDHLATGKIVESAAHRQEGKLRLRYFHSKNANIFEDISQFHDANLTALRCYKSQYSITASPPFLLHLLERERLRRTRRYGAVSGSRFAEAFREVS
jgi:LmbE family N-acetylglucosaminyl deacetylase